MKITSLRHQLRQANLALLIKEFGGATALANLIGTPKSHVSAMLSGTRGMGDALAEKIERKCEKPRGWMDEQHEGLSESPATKSPPPPPSPNFEDRREVSDSDWQVLQDVHLVLSDDELAQIRERAERTRRIAREQIEGVVVKRRSTSPSHEGGHLGGLDDLEGKRADPAAKKARR